MEAKRTYDVRDGRAEYGHHFWALVQRFRTVEEDTRTLVYDNEGKVINIVFLRAVQPAKVVAD